MLARKTVLMLMKEYFSNNDVSCLMIKLNQYLLLMVAGLTDLKVLRLFVFIISMNSYDVLTLWMKRQVMDDIHLMFVYKGFVLGTRNCLVGMLQFE